MSGRNKQRLENLARLTGLGYRIDRLDRGKKHLKAYVTAPDGRKTMFTIVTANGNWRSPRHFDAQARRFLRASSLA